ncbi:hypothetical protein L226DRAFT_564422 [Lentinus tigrinus ALCF2SS1-7]|uniref:uncharacterized protein n=1 Tax=Lentinus tigrinus ALCF2SS1-7 TaxID=1328758 RepID=UPI001165E730|nr:hypothetical protein L226DRAFT_564422 [Lentinus tigrinus ALCF2SS1-7]
MEQQPATPCLDAVPLPSLIPAVVNMDSEVGMRSHGPSIDGSLTAPQHHPQPLHWDVPTADYWMPATPRLCTIPLPCVPVPAGADARFNVDLNVEVGVEGDVEPNIDTFLTAPQHQDYPPLLRERTPATPRLRTIPLPSVPDFVLVGDDAQSNVNVDVDVEGDVEPSINPLLVAPWDVPAVGRPMERPPATPRLRTIPLPSVPDLVLVGDDAQSNIVLNVELDVEDDVGPSMNFSLLTAPHDHIHP